MRYEYLLHTPEGVLLQTSIREKGSIADGFRLLKPTDILFGEEAMMLEEGWYDETGKHLGWVLPTPVTKERRKWPKGTPGGKGGQWRAKDGGFAMGGDGVWRTADGTPATEAQAARIKWAKISRGYKNVQLNPDPGSEVLAVGTDAKGRRKTFYAASFHDRQKALKFKRNEAFHRARPQILESIRYTIKHGAGRDREAAMALLLIDKTGFRPGSDKNTRASVKAYGATTLRGEHLSVNGDTLTFSFVGKNGKTIRKSVADRELVGLLRDRVGKPARVFNTSAAELNGFLKRNGYGKFLVKDFRTWNGTAKALETMKTMPTPTNTREFKRMQKQVATVVSQHLGNTPAMALNAYINPAVWGRWTITEKPRRVRVGKRRQHGPRR